MSIEGLGGELEEGLKEELGEGKTVNKFEIKKREFNDGYSIIT